MNRWQALRQWATTTGKRWLAALVVATIVRALRSRVHVSGEWVTAVLAALSGLGGWICSWSRRGPQLVADLLFAICVGLVVCYGARGFVAQDGAALSNAQVCELGGLAFVASGIIPVSSGGSILNALIERTLLAVIVIFAGPGLAVLMACSAIRNLTSRR